MSPDCLENLPGRIGVAEVVDQKNSCCAEETLSLKIGRMVYFSEQGPRELVSAFVNDIRSLILNPNGSISLRDLEQFEDEEGAWNVLRSFRSIKNPNQILCFLINPNTLKPDPDPEEPFCKIVPQEEIIKSREPALVVSSVR